MNDRDDSILGSGSSDEEISFHSSSFGRHLDSILSRPGIRRRRGRAIFLGGAAGLFFSSSNDAGDRSSESMEVDTEDTCSTSGEILIHQPQSLLDLASQVVAQHCSCSELDQQKPPLDEALLRKVAYWAFPQDIRRVRAFAYLTDRLVNWRRAMLLVKESKIKEMWQVGFMATAYMIKHAQPSDSRAHSEIRVSIMFEKQRIISSSCSECKNEIWCEHVLAAVMHRIKYPSLVTVHAPMTETLSTLDRNQLQKLLQYAVNEDPAGILGKVFKHFDNVRDSKSEMNKTDGAPDPTYGGLTLGDKSQWELSLELLDKRLASDLDAMIRTRSYYDYAEGRTQEYYPDNFDLTLKMKSKFFTYITPVLELVRQEESVAAAEVMQHIVTIVVQKMRTTSRSDCSNLSRLWHDLSHMYTLLLLRTEDITARNLLISGALNIRTTDSLRAHLTEQSRWAELPSLASLYANDAAKYKAEGHILIEPLIAKSLNPSPPELRTLLDGKDTIDKTLYDEDLVVMIARLETVFYFERDRSYEKIAQITFIVLHKLSILAQKDSVIGEYMSSASPDSSATMFKIFRLDDRGGGETKASTPSTTPSTTPTTSKGKGKSATRGPSKNKHPAKRFKSNHCNVTQASLTCGQIAHAMLFTLHLVIESRKGAPDSINRKLLTGFCLQALELSRHRTLASASAIHQLEQDWCLKLETCVCEYLETSEAAIESNDAVSMYVDAIASVGTSFYNGAYPLVLLEMLCHLCTKNETLKETKRKHLVKICAEILLNSTSCLEKVTLMASKNLEYFFWEVLMEGGDVSSTRKHREFAVKKFHVITETFLSLVGTNSEEDIVLLVEILKHFENIKTATLLKLISKDLRMHVWRFKDERRVIEAMLRFSIHACRETLSSTLVLGSLSVENKRFENVDRDFVFTLARKLDVARLSIFSGCWQDIFSCKDLQELLLSMELKITEQSTFPPEVAKIIDEFYDAKRPHDEDACALLTRFYRNGDENYQRTVEKILANSENYHAGALFHLAQLQLADRQQEHLTKKTGKRSRSVDKATKMDTSVFGIVVKAFEKITTVTPKILEAIDWVFTTVTSGSCTQKKESTSRKDPSRSPFYTRMVACICSTSVKSHPEIILKVLQSVEPHVSLMRSGDTSVMELGVALINAYKDHFLVRFRDCGHAAYTTVIGEMLRARLECKRYIKNGDNDFDAEVVEFIRRMHSTKKKLMKLLVQDFPIPAS